MYKYDNVTDKIEHYIFKRDIPTSNPYMEKTCFAFGYLDGYYNEEMYEDFIDFKEKQVVAYNKGYHIGEEARKEKNDEKAWLEEKEKFIITIASYDSLNGLPRRRISNEYKNLYCKRYADFSELRENSNKGKKL